jgi:UDP-glucose 4-epimerase
MNHNFERILVTGGAGFIGSHIVDKLIEDFDVTVIDNLNTGSPANINHHQKKNFHFIEGDIRDFNLVKETMKDIDAVFHEAALASVTLSVENPILLSSPISNNLNAFVIRT